MKATNQLLDDLAGSGRPGMQLDPEQNLADRFSVGRSAMRAVLAYLENVGVVKREGRARVLQRRPVAGDYYDLPKTESRKELVQRRFLELTLSGRLLPGQLFSEAEVARNFGASTVSVREFLIDYSRYGLVEKTAGGSWRFCAFDAAFALELAQVRQMFELAALNACTLLPPGDPFWLQLDGLRQRHEAMASGGDEAVRQFSNLDREFHRLLTAQLKNRFIEDLFDVVSFVFHYHYQWRRDDQIARNLLALSEHRRIIDALLQRDFARAQKAMEAHLATSVRTLLESALPFGQFSPAPA